MKQKELTQTFMMILNWKKPFGLHDLYKKYFSALRVKYFIYPANTGHSPDAVSMLGQRRRRCANIETALDECPVFAG